jgi:hypothetical protein
MLAVAKHPHRGLNYRFLLPVGDIRGGTVPPAMDACTKGLSRDEI